MAVPDEFAGEFYQPDLLAVEFPHHAGIPVIVDGRQLLGQVYFFHESLRSVVWDFILCCRIAIREPEPEPPARERGPPLPEPK
jgi:hypothetical protein